MGIVCNRLAASRSHRRVTISTARRGDLPFVPAKGSKTGSRGTDSPLTNPFLSLAVLDTNDAKASSVQRRRYAVKAPAAHFIRFLQTNSRKLRCQDYGLNKQLFGKTAPPPPRGRGRGCGAERRQWRMQRGGAPVAVEKIEQASSAKIFSGTARRWGQMLPQATFGAHLCAVRIWIFRLRKI